MADPNVVQAVADHTQGVIAQVVYYAPAFFAAITPIVYRYVKPVIEAVVQLPALMIEQNRLLAEANAQRKTQTETIANK